MSFWMDFTDNGEGDCARPKNRTRPDILLIKLKKSKATMAKNPNGKNLLNCGVTTQRMTECNSGFCVEKNFVFSMKECKHDYCREYNYSHTKHSFSLVMVPSTGDIVLNQEWKPPWWMSEAPASNVKTPSVWVYTYRLLQCI